MSKNIFISSVYPNLENTHILNGQEEIIRGVPWQHLPRLLNIDHERLVHASTFGKGRVVLLDYQQPFLEPSRSDFKWDVDFDLHCLTPAWVQVSRFANNWPTPNWAFHLLLMIYLGFIRLLPEIA